MVSGISARLRRHYDQCSAGRGYVGEMVSDADEELVTEYDTPE